MSETKRRGLPPGVQRKHSRRCPAFQDREARCRGKGCTYQVQAGPRGARQTKTTLTLDEAVNWKRDVDAAVRAGRFSRERSPTLREAVQRWRADVAAGVALARGRKPFKPSTLREYERMLEIEWLPGYGTTRLDALDLSACVAEVQRRGLSASTVRNIVMPVRAVYRHALRMKWVAANPTLGLEVPAGSGRRMRVVEPHMIGAYLHALEERDRPLWATAVYAGLRRSELMALRWADVDLAGGLITVAGAYDQKTRTTGTPKSEAGARRVPIGGELREHLIAHRSRSDPASGFVYCRSSLGGAHYGDGSQPFNDATPGKRARKAWLEAGLASVTLHDCRHTFASLVIAAMAARGVFNPKLLQTVMGHSSIGVTYDRYGHLFPGQEAEVGVMLDDFLAVSREREGNATIGHDEPADGTAEIAQRAVSVQRTYGREVQR